MSKNSKNQGLPHSHGYGLGGAIHLPVQIFQMGYSLNSLKGDYTGDYYRAY